MSVPVVFRARRARPRALAVFAVACLAALAAAPPALAAPPLGNDNFQSPYNVDIAGGEVFDLNGEAFTQTDEPLTPTGPGYCNSGGVQRDMRATVWYRILGNGGRISIDTFGSNFNTVIAAYAAQTALPGDPLSCNDDAGGTLQSAISFNSVTGSAYLIQVGGCNGCGGFDAGEIRMHVSATGPPPPVVQPPVVLLPPDADGDGVPDARDKCPTVRPTRDRNNDGCQDKPQRIRADIGFDRTYLRRGGAIRGVALSSTHLVRVPKGATVRVTCTSSCLRRNARGRPGRFSRHTFKARRLGTQRVAPLNGLLLTRGKRVVVVVTAPDRLGARMVVTMGARKEVVKLSCLAVGSSTRRVSCATGS